MDESYQDQDYSGTTASRETVLGNPFSGLASRVLEFLADHGGRAAEDELIAHVFGSNGSAALWRPLLRDILGNQEGVTLRTDGAWILGSAVVDGAGDVLTDFIAIDVETTGLQASRQRIIEIAVATFRGGECATSWESLCHPGRKVPAYVCKLTGIDDDLLRDAPPFDTIADHVCELFSGAVVVGHNVEFDLAFINEELKRCGRNSLVNDRVDTLSLASRLIPGLRKPTLDAIAQRTGAEVKPRTKHRAGTDARLTGQIALSLFALARQSGYTSFEEIKSIAAPRPRRPKERMPRASSVVDRKILTAIPRAPGVYVMRDANERVVYVGKAKNLRERVATYFNQPLGYTRKMDGLIESLKRIEVEVVGSELEALLLESQLIRRYQPRYNTALRAHEQYPFIRVDVANPWPRVALAKARKNDGARYFGPFRSATTARKTVDLINRVVPLRTCTRSFRDARSYGSPCLELDLGRCLGPCVGRANRDEYMGLVRRVIDFVDGRDEALQEFLWSGLESAAESLDFERASRLRRELQATLSLTSASRRLREAVDADCAVLVTASAETDHREIMVIVRGRIWAQLRCANGEQAAVLADRLATCWRRFEQAGMAEPDHDSIDDLHILKSWLSRHEGIPAYMLIETTGGQPNWEAVAGRVLTLLLEDLDFDAWRKARDAEELGGDEVAELEDEFVQEAPVAR